jgi:WD40 repeat protein
MMRVASLLVAVCLTPVAYADSPIHGVPDPEPGRLVHPESIITWSPVRVAVPQAGGEITALAFAPNGRTLASLNSDRVLCLWDVESGKKLRQQDLSHARGNPWSISFSPEGDALILLDHYEGQKVTCLWNLTSGQKSPLIKTGPGGKAVCPRGRLLAYGDGLWEVATGKRLRQFQIPRGLIYQIEFSPDGRTLAYWMCEGLAQEASLILVLDVATGKKVLQVGEFDWANLHLGSFKSPPTFSPDSKAIAFADEGSVRIRSLANDRDVRLIRRNMDESAGVLAFSADGTSIITRHDGRRGEVFLYDAATGREQGCMKVESAKRLVFSPSGKTMAVVKGTTWQGTVPEYRPRYTVEFWRGRGE